MHKHTLGCPIMCFEWYMRIRYQPLQPAAWNSVIQPSSAGKTSSTPGTAHGNKKNIRSQNTQHRYSYNAHRHRITILLVNSHCITRVASRTRPGTIVERIVIIPIIRCITFSHSSSRISDRRHSLPGMHPVLGSRATLANSRLLPRAVARIRRSGRATILKNKRWRLCARGLTRNRYRSRSESEDSTRGRAGPPSLDAFIAASLRFVLPER